MLSVEEYEKPDREPDAGLVGEKSTYVACERGRIAGIRRIGMSEAAQSIVQGRTTFPPSLQGQEQFGLLEADEGRVVSHPDRLPEGFEGVLTVQQEHTGVGRDSDSDLIGHREAAAALKALLVQEHPDVSAQFLLIGRG